MLKITVDHRSEEVRFSLEGKLAGPWVKELRRSWEAGGCAAACRLVLDLSEVDFVDPEGQLLLAELQGHGVKLVAATPLIREMVAEICRPGSCDTVEEGAPRSIHATSERTGSGSRTK